MKIVKLQGRMGNQLFQYALALTLKKKFNEKILIDHFEDADYVKLFFNYTGVNSYGPSIKNTFLKKIKRRLDLAYKKILQFSIFRSKVFIQSGWETGDSFDLNHVANYTFFLGFFQSEQYFQSLIQKDKEPIFSIKSQYIKEFNSRYASLFNSTHILAVHYRAKDYKEFGEEKLGGKNLCLPVSYYDEAIKNIYQIDQYKVYIVTDDIEDAKTKFLYRDIEYVSESEMLDFQFLLNADALILSNSTFSWWAGYLNTKAKQILAPKYWLGFKVNIEFPNSIIPEKFTPVDFKFD